MKKSIIPWAFTLCLVLLHHLSPAQNSGLAAKTVTNNRKQWKAGVASVIITPEKPILMAGFTSRKHPATGKNQELWAKALALEDDQQKRLLLITSDLEELPKGMSDRIRNRLASLYKLSKAQIIINCSHSHSSPALKEIAWMYTEDPAQIRDISQYSDLLEKQLTDIAGKAINALRSAELYSKNGVVRFQVNRRNNTESQIISTEEIRGPADYAVPVIKVLAADKKLLAVVFGYACHNSVLNGYDWSGDFAGFAQAELEKEYPGTLAMFFQGAGGNQIAYPRRSVAAARFHGKSLAAAVDRVLKEGMRKLTPNIIFGYKEIDLPISPPTSEEVLLKITRSSSATDSIRWARKILGNTDKNKRFKSSYPYPIQVWRLGEQTLFSMGGEVVVEYALALKRMFGQDIFVAGYSNDVMAYIPSAAIVREGGYEGAASITSSSGCLPAPWSVSIEPIIIENIRLLAKRTGLSAN